MKYRYVHLSDMNWCRQTSCVHKYTKCRFPYIKYSHLEELGTWSNSFSFTVVRRLAVGPTGQYKLARDSNPESPDICDLMFILSFAVYNNLTHAQKAFCKLIIQNYTWNYYLSTVNQQN